jgi:predicted unusual protein kinase regulating ubiquinone biosynthesis (AarF/ABC1/UbiB family)
MISKSPIGKIERALTGGRTAAKVGGKVLLHYAKRSFMDAEARREDEEKMFQEGAKTLFAGLSLLKGTALKMAQQLSLEMDLLPEAACKELAKSYHQVPPINRALVRKVILNGLGRPPEEIFEFFDLTAFAAASLGQVHKARDKENNFLAVKIQYPGIAKTIDGDMTLLRQILRPIIQSDQLLPALTEVSERLHEEVNYLTESDNLKYLKKHLKINGVSIPKVWPDKSAETVLTTTLMPGKPLDYWLSTNPDQDAIDCVARKLQQIIIKSLYELNVIHADPNPGTFIIADDLTIGLVDFGCVKYLDPLFVEQYRRLSKSAFCREDGGHLQLMMDMGVISKDLDPAIIDKIREIAKVVGNWFSRLCEEEQFDFKRHPDFIAEGKEVMRQFQHLRRYAQVNPNFIFLDRTRYGLLRLFEQMGAKVCFRNKYEWGSEN